MQSPFFVPFLKCFRLCKDEPNGDDVGDAAAETEEVEGGVHVGLAEGVEDGAGYVGDTAGYEPPEGGGGMGEGEMVQQGLEGDEDGGTHGDVAESFEVAVLLEVGEAENQAEEGAEPDEGEDAPTPGTGVAEDEEGERGVGAGNVEVDGGVVEVS